MNYDEEQLLPLSGIQHFAFCQRQWALIHLEQQWSESVRTVEGAHLHERVHSMLPTESRGEIVSARSLPLVSYRLGLFGVADLVEFHAVETSDANTIKLPGREGYWAVHPVEYKRGRPKSDDRDEVQLCAQTMCLEEMLSVEVKSGSFYYGQIRHRAHLTIGTEIRARVESLACQMHEVYKTGITPAASSRTKCKLCSLRDLCLPSVFQGQKRVSTYIQAQINKVGNEVDE